MTTKTLPKQEIVDVWRDPFADTFVIESADYGPLVMSRGQMGRVFDRFLQRLWRINEDNYSNMTVQDVSDAQLVELLAPDARPSLTRLLGDKEAKSEAEKLAERKRLAKERAAAETLALNERRQRRAARDQYAATRDAVLNQIENVSGGPPFTIRQRDNNLVDPNHFYIDRSNPNFMAVSPIIPEPEPEEYDREEDDEDRD